MTCCSISQNSLAAAGARVNTLDFVIVGISHPKVILGIFHAQAVLESHIKTLTINITKTKKFTTAADGSHR
jgi:hypothetical protein